MCKDDSHPPDAAPQPEPIPDPAAELVSRFRFAVEQGDFRRARRIIEEGKDGLDSALQAELDGQLDRLRPDRAAVVTAVVCGVILVILAATTLFH